MEIEKTGEVVTARRRAGVARMESLSTEERKELATKAARSRWADLKTIKVATLEGDISLLGGAIKLQCAVLEDGTRVLTQGGFLQAIGRHPTPKSSTRNTVGTDKAVPFLEASNLQAYISDELRANSEPIVIRLPEGGKALGYRADILPQVCNVYLAARADGKLSHMQMATAQACEVLVRALAHVGIIALVDEATEYERFREKNALANILEAYIARELQPYVTTFPTTYYENLFRLRGVEYSASSVKRPQYFGILTNDLIYSRLAPGVLAELKKEVPRDGKGRPTAKLFQKLTANVGYPKLREHIGAVVAFMRISRNYAEFLRLMNEHYPRYAGDTVQSKLPFPYDSLGDNGTGI